MKNTLTGLLIIVFLIVYSVSLSIINFSFEKKIENNLCGYSIGNSFNTFNLNGADSARPVVQSKIIHALPETQLNNIDNNSFSDLFAVNQQMFSFGAFHTSRFISRENQILKQLFSEPVFVPS